MTQERKSRVQCAQSITNLWSVYHAKIVVCCVANTILHTLILTVVEDIHMLIQYIRQSINLLFGLLFICFIEAKFYKFVRSKILFPKFEQINFDSSKYSILHVHICLLQ